MKGLSGRFQKQVSVGTERVKGEEIRKRAWEAKDEKGERWFVVKILEPIRCPHGVLWSGYCFCSILLEGLGWEHGPLPLSAVHTLITGGPPTKWGQN